MTSALPQGPLSVGNIVSTGFRLYLANFVRYLLISLRASLWLVVPWLVAIAFFLFILLSGQDIAGVMGFLALLIPVVLVLLVICGAQSLGEFAAIARLAYQELNSISESNRDALRFTRSRKWSILGANILRGLLFLGSYLGISLVMAIVLGILSFVATQLFGGTPGTGFAIVVGFFVLIAILAIVAFFIRLGVGLMLIVPPLAVEEGANATSALGRSWTLTQAHIVHCIAVSFVAFLVGLPISMVGFTISQIVSTLLSGLGSALDPTFQVLIILLSSVIGILSGIVTAPFWQVILATLYWDLRNRSEGLDLKLSR